MLSPELNTFLSSPVKAFARFDVPRLRLNADLKTVGEVFRKSPLNCVLLTDKSGKLAGLLDSNDISRMTELANPATSTAFDLLQIHPTYLSAVKEDGQMWEALKAMNGELNGKRVDLLPVISSANEPIGVIFRSDLERDVLRSAVTGSISAVPA
jgi:predicted transcriptional regulator